MSLWKCCYLHDAPCLLDILLFKKKSDSLFFTLNPHVDVWVRQETFHVLHSLGLYSADHIILLSLARAASCLRE